MAKKENTRRIALDSKSIYAVGDIHGVFSSLVSTIKRYDITDSAIVCCGDCGLGFDRTPDATKLSLKPLDRICSERNVRVIMMRGNHDDPSFFNNGTVNTECITAVPDYTVINGNILLVGGATSVDRTSRIASKERLVREYLKYHPGKSARDAEKSTSNCYWTDEQPVFDEAELQAILDEGIRIEHVCTHSCPSFCDPQDKDGLHHWSRMDPALLGDVANERKTMDLLWERLRKDGHPLKSWIYGHYHRHSAQSYEGVAFTMLGAVLADGMYPDWIEIR